jgi:DNA invertase Pin-like site-specific DNA recombinase
MLPRGIGIVRVSQRDDDSGRSPEVQARAMLKQAGSDGFTLQPEDIWDENIDSQGRVRPASGGAALDDRPKLKAALEAGERGEVQVIVAERFDRLFRDLDVQREVIRRADAAGVRLVTAAGQISHATAEAELQANLNGAIAQYQKRTAIERSKAAVQLVIDSGVAPYGHVPTGYRRRGDGVYEPSGDAHAVDGAFRVRAHGGTVDEAWRHLQAHDITITYSGTYQLLRSRVYLGEIHFGTLTPNLAAHEPLVDRDTWDAVQRARSPSGRKAKSERLLARLGVLLCGTCGSRLAGSTATGATSSGGGGGRKYPIYRCGNKTCPRPVSISAPTVEAYVVERLRAEHADMRGRASAESRALAAEALAEHAQAELDAAIRTLSIVGDEPATIQRLAGLRDARDGARAEAVRLGGLSRSKAVDLSRWDEFTLAEQRAAIRGTVARVLVAPGRAAGRLSIEFF